MTLETMTAEARQSSLAFAKEILHNLEEVKKEEDINEVVNTVKEYCTMSRHYNWDEYISGEHELAMPVDGMIRLMLKVAFKRRPGWRNEVSSSDNVLKTFVDISKRAGGSVFDNRRNAMMEVANFKLNFASEHEIILSFQRNLDGRLILRYRRTLYNHRLMQLTMRLWGS
jgi:hypothetical protein